MKKIINLNGTWKFTPMFDQRPKQNENYDLYRDERLSKKDWLDVKVPGVWQRYGEKFSIFEGVCWFYKEFELEELSSNLFAKLVFKGVDYEAKVYMNGQDVGIHESAYTEFSFNISNFLREGKNSIAVRVDNRPTTTKWPSDWGYGIYGGIHRDVFIELYDSDFIYDMKIQPDYNLDKNIGVINFAAEGNASEIQLKVNGETYYIPCIDNKYKEIVELENIIPWSPETPKLYKLEVVVNGQTYNEMNIGFRNINFKDRKILLNGKSVEIKGACYLCDSPKTGLAMDKEELRVDLMSMKDANVNAIRTHYPMSDSFYELCDELGFMVWIETNVYC